MNQFLKYGMLAGMFLLLWMPYLQKKFYLVETEVLTGAFTPAENPEFSLRSFLKGKYQKQKEEHYRTAIGFHEDAIRLKNQMDYSLFTRLNVDEVYAGKEGYFFRFYDPKYNSKMDYLGRKEVKKRVLKMTKLRDHLNSQGKEFIFLIAASKHIYYKEYLPEQFKDPYLNGPNNLQDFCYYLDSLQIPYIDYNSWFLKMKDTVSFPIFAKTGFNWTAMAGLYVTDSLSGLINSMDSNRMSHLIWDKTTHHYDYESDMEIGASLNLFETLDENKLTYPVNLRSDQSSKKPKPKVVMVSDCSWFSPLWYGTAAKIFDEQSDYFYYDHYRDNFLQERQDYKEINEVSADKEYIIFMANIPNLTVVPWGHDDVLLGH